MANVEILTKYAAQIAAGKENRAGAPATDQDTLLAEMGTDGTNGRFGTDAAKARLPLPTMRLAPPGAQRTGIDRIPQPLNRLIRLIAHNQ